MSCRFKQSLLHNVASNGSGDDGYHEYKITLVQALARIPQEHSPVEAGPLMRAGITTFKAPEDTPRMLERLIRTGVIQCQEAAISGQSLPSFADRDPEKS